MNEYKIHELLMSIIEESGSFFVTISQIRIKLPLSLKKDLGISSQRTSNSKVLESLVPFFNNVLDNYKKGVSQCIGLKMSYSDMILWQLKKTPNKSSKELKQRLPMKLDDYIETMSVLLKEQIVCCSRLTKNHMAAAFMLTGDSQNSTPSNQQEAKKQFKEAYDIAGGGRPYVYIHKIRKQLKWKTKDFDNVLEELAKQQVIELQGGNPVTLSKQEIEQSFYDKMGYLRITVTWRERI